MSVPVFPPASGGGGGGADFTAIMKNTSGSPPASGISLAAIFSGGAGLLKVATDGTVSKAVAGTDYAVPSVVAFPTQTISVETSTVTFSGLNGDTDSAIYEFDGDGVCGTGCTIAGSGISCNFNGLTTNQSCQASHLQNVSGGTLTFFGSATIGYVGLEAAAGQAFRFHCRVYPKSGRARRVEWTCSMFSGTAASVQQFAGEMYWSDTSTNVTSIAFVDRAGNAFFGVGSIISGRKILL